MFLQDKENKKIKKERGVCIMTNKMTKRDYFNVLKGIDEVAANDELVAFIDHEIELLDKKAGKGSKPTATQIANEALKNDILAVLSTDSGMSVSDILATGGAFEGLSNQKVSAVLRLMEKNDGTVRKEKDKKRTIFFKVEA
jgi:hypothetical protein